MNFRVNDIFENRTILAELEKAWLESKPNISGGQENGGFVVADDFGILSIVRWEKGTQNEIIVPRHKNCFFEGKDIIASFHTHPNTGEDFQQEPSLTDIRAVRDDPDLKGEFYLGEFVISAENVYLIKPSGLFSVIGKTENYFER